MVNPIIPQQLQQQRPQKPPTVAQQQEIRKYGVQNLEQLKAVKAEEARLLELERKRQEELAKQQVAAQAAATITIGNKSFSRTAVEKALRHIERKTQGKKSVELYNDNEAKRAFEAILQYGVGDVSGKEVRKQLSAGATIAIAGGPEQVAIKKKLGIPLINPQLQQAALQRAVDQVVAGKIPVEALAEGLSTADYKNIKEYIVATKEIEKQPPIVYGPQKPSPDTFITIPDKTDTGYYKQGWISAGKQSVQNILYNIGALTTGKPFKDIGLRYVDTKKYEETVPFEAKVVWRGTEFGGEEYTPTMYQSTKGLTYQELSERGFTVSDLYKQKGERVEGAIKTAAETGALIGLTLAGPGGQAIAGSYLISQSVPLLGKATAPITPAPGYVGGLKDEYSISSRLGYAGMGALYLGAGLWSAGSAIRGAQRAVDIEALKQLERQRGIIAGEEIYRGPTGSLYRVKVGKTYGASSLKTQLNMPVYSTGDKAFSITGGRGMSRLKYFSYEKQRWITSEQTFGFGGRGTYKPIEGVEGVESTIGSGYYISKTPEQIKIELKTASKGGLIRYRTPDVKKATFRITTEKAGKEMQPFKFAGLTEEIPETTIYKIVTGEPKKVRIYDFDLSKKSLLFEPKSAGFIKRFEEIPESIMKIPGATQVRPLAKIKPGFFKQALQQESKTILSQETKVGIAITGKVSTLGERAVISLVQPTVTTTSQVALPLIVGGVGGLAAASKYDTKLYTGLSSLSLLGQETEQMARTTTGETLRFGLIEDTTSRLKITPDTLLRSVTTPETTTKIIPQPISPAIPSIQFPGEPEVPYEPGKPPTGIFLPGRKPKATKEQPYNAYVYVDATKGQKAGYKQVNKQPLTLRSALSTMARVVDNTISARGKVSIAKPKVVNKKKVTAVAIDTGDRYFENNRQKFRTYKTTKKVPLPTGTVIERQKYRLDSPGETRQIQKAKRTPFGF